MKAIKYSRQRESVKACLMAVRITLRQRSSTRQSVNNTPILVWELCTAT